MKKRKSFLLRIQPDLYKEIEAWAQQELRSVNGQIEFLLKDAVRKRGRAADQAGVARDQVDQSAQGES